MELVFLEICVLSACVGCFLYFVEICAFEAKFGG